jgi:hypothetical protein
MINNQETNLFKKELLLFIILGMVLLNIFNFAIYWSYLAIPIAFVLFRDYSSLLDTRFFFLVLFSVLYFICLTFTGIPLRELSISMSTKIGYLVLPAVFYFLGKYIIYKYPKLTTFYSILFFICIFFSILPFLANIRSVFENGFMQQRNLRLFWMGQGELTAATEIGSYFALNLTLIPILFIRKNTAWERNLALFALVLFAMGIFSTLNISYRTGILLTFSTLLVFLFVPGKGFHAFLMVGTFILIIIVLYLMNAWGIRFWFEHSYFFERIAHTDISQESRISIWKNNLIGLFRNPYGHFRTGIGNDFAHNLWLDVGLRTGFMPLLPLLVFTVMALVTQARLIYDRSADLFLRVLLAGSAVAFYVTFFFEPALEGLFIMFFIYCFYTGMVQELSENPEIL